MINVLKMVLNHSRGHITAKTASKGPKLWHFFIVHFGLQANAERGTAPLVALLIISFVWISVFEQN